MIKYQNILLIYPKVPSNTYWSFKHTLKVIRKKSAMPPLGLMTIAAFFPDTYHLKLVDMNVSPLSDNDIAWADAVFISAMIVQRVSMEDAIRRCRQFGKTIVAGGPFPTSNHEDIAGVDHFLTGEVDQTLTDFLQDLEKGIAKPVYAKPPYPDISNLPVPRFDLLDITAYGSMSIQYSRGCPFHCEFCDIWSIYGNKPRLKSVGAILHELDTLFDLGWRGPVFIVDDNFIGNKKKVKADLLPALKTWQVAHDYPFHFFTEASINMASDENLLAAMREVGFNQVFIGIETPDPEGLKETGKIQNLNSDMEASIRSIQRHGMEVMAGFILGFDNDKEDIFDRQIDFIQRNAIPKAMIGFLNALPGTRLYRRLMAEGRILKASIGNNTHNMTINFKTMMDPGRLKEGYKKILNSIYDFNLKNYFDRCSRFLDTIEHTDYFQRKIYFDEIKILFRSICLQLFTPYGFQYFKFISRNMIKHPRIFAEAVSLSISGHHFYTITQQTLKTEKIASILDEKYHYFCDLVNESSEAMRTNSKKRLQYMTKLWKERVKLLKQMQHTIDHIHGDYRYELSQKYFEISKKMREKLANFETMVMGTAAPSRQ
ncbi:MAG: B12-binding domain-containing radical SAM protein [Desulfobacterales bacterium]